MERDDLIPATEFCIYCHIAPSVITDLHEAGLVEIVVLEGRQFLYLEHIRETEKLIRMHTELEINLQGIEAILHLLKKIDTMEQQIRALEQQLKLYEP